MYKSFFKRLIDFFLALIGFIILFPVFTIITIVLWFDFKGNPFFTQDRPGKDEKVFYVVKFKTMNDKKDGEGNLLSDEERLTSMGKIIRKTSFDEIPQLINVLKGDMSLIGPRPLRTYYLPYYTEKERMRHSVRPGITGLAQVSGRNFIDWDQRFAHDLEYVKNLSFFLDVKILWWTFKKVVAAKDVALSNEEIIDNFDIYRKKQIDQGKVVL